MSRCSALPVRPPAGSGEYNFRRIFCGSLRRHGGRIGAICDEAQARLEHPDPRHRALEIEALLAMPWLVSGGDVLVEVRVPSGIRARQVEVLLNGIDVSHAFRPPRHGDRRRHPGQRVLRGLVSGLDLGSNSLTVTVERHRGKDLSRTLELINWPLSGPIISGPHEEPFFCQTEEFEIAGGVLEERLGPPLDENCSIETRVDYLYKSTDGSLKALERYPNRTVRSLLTPPERGSSEPRVVWSPVIH